MNFELSTATKIGDLEWPWTTQWPLYGVISLNLEQNRRFSVDIRL